MKSRLNRSSARRKGLAIIITALMLTFVIPVVGLAIDAGVLYAVKAKLQSAVDAASMAAARSLSRGLTAEAQKASAILRARAFFDANFPEGLMATGEPEFAADVKDTSLRTRTVEVSGGVPAPVYFMRVLGFDTTTVRAFGKASRRDVNVMLVIDRSKSLDLAGSCDDVENAALAFIDLFANDRDKLGMVSFGGSYRLDFPLNDEFKTGSGNLVDMVKTLYPGGCEGYTGSAQGLWKGYENLVATPEPGVLNVILFFTDGIPNAITAEFRVKPATTQCYDWANGKFKSQTGWNISGDQRYLGFIVGQSSGGTSMDQGVRGHVADPMPVDDDPPGVAVPVGYSGAAKSPASGDCHYLAGPPNSYNNWENDIAYYPDEDYYGNSVFGWKTPVNKYTSGTYNGRVRVDDRANLERAAINAVDNAAARIRNNALAANVNTMVYTIGLGDVGTDQHTLLRRIANDPASPIYNDTKLTGMYVYAPTAADLNQAFVMIASEILRYAQ